MGGGGRGWGRGGQLGRHRRHVQWGGAVGVTFAFERASFWRSDTVCLFCASIRRRVNSGGMADQPSPIGLHPRALSWRGTAADAGGVAGEGEHNDGNVEPPQ